jgi:hypothetical protein
VGEEPSLGIAVIEEIVREPSYYSSGVICEALMDQPGRLCEGPPVWLSNPIASEKNGKRVISIKASS